MSADRCTGGYTSGLAGLYIDIPMMRVKLILNFAPSQWPASTIRSLDVNHSSFFKSSILSGPFPFYAFHLKLPKDIGKTG